MVALALGVEVAVGVWLGIVVGDAV